MPPLIRPPFLSIYGYITYMLSQGVENFYLKKEIRKFVLLKKHVKAQYILDRSGKSMVYAI